MTVFLVILVIAVIAIGAWLWYTNTPAYKAAKARDAATQAALAATGHDGTSLQQGVYDTIDAAKAQRRAGDTSVDPGQAGIGLVRNSYLAIPTKWQEERATDIADPERRVNIMNNLVGMFEATTQLFAGSIPSITSQAGLDDAKGLYLQMVTDAIARRDCWWRRQPGCWRNWSVGEPSEDSRLSEEQGRIRDFSQRILPALALAAKKIPGSTLFTPSELATLHTSLDGGDPTLNPYDDATFAQIQSELA